MFVFRFLIQQPKLRLYAVFCNAFRKQTFIGRVFRKSVECIIFTSRVSFQPFQLKWNMIQGIEIENYKSIEKLEIELGRINVFIGDNGCGKTNILEAMAFASAFEGTYMASDEIFFWKGIRHAKSDLIFSAFNENPIEEQTTVSITIDIETDKILYLLENDELSSDWFNLGVRFTHISKEQIPIDSRDSIIKAYEEENFDEYDRLIKTVPVKLSPFPELKNFVIYQPNILMLRGMMNLSQLNPVGIYGERLDELIDGMKPEEMSKLKEYRKFISWLKDFDASGNDHKRLKLHKSNSNLSFTDRFMRKDANSLSAEIVNEGVLFVLFYLSLFISHKTPAFFAIDNIEQSWNPHLCRVLMEELCKIAKESNKQALITTHNPAILDGLNLHNDEIRLFEVHRDKKGRTKVRRIKTIKEFDDKLSNLWTGGILGGISKEY